MKKKSTNSRQIVRKITTLSLFLAMGIILNIIESFIPLPISIPGVKLGLANTIGLVVLYYYSPKEYAYIGLLRVVVVGLLRTGILSISFLLSLSGWFLSTLIAILLYYFKKFSIFGLSCASAVFHGVGQILAVMAIYSSPGLILYLPILMLTGVISGTLTAAVTSLVLLKLDKHISFIVKE